MSGFDKYILAAHKEFTQEKCPNQNGFKTEIILPFRQYRDICCRILPI